MVLSRLLPLLLVIALSGCKKESPTAAVPAKAGSSASVDSLLNQGQAPPTAPVEAPVTPPAAETPPETGTPKTAGGDFVGGQFSLPPDARKKRNLEWLRILKSGTAQQQQQVQDQMTKLSSDELHEITALYQSQQK
jgi:hypothetical protein